MASTTETMSYQDSLNSQYLTSSISSLSRSKSTNSFIVRTYKQATQLYLTKRFKEALETLLPIITPQQGPLSDSIDDVLNARSNGRPSGLVPVAVSSKGTRTKVWVFYLSLLHAIVELGPEQGKLAFGSTRWKELAAKTREGSIWDEVVRHGYEGQEGEVDAEVVVNLATLLLGHMQNQKLNQRRLEAYLAASGGTEGPQYIQDGLATPMSDYASSPKELTSRLKVLELYTLHVLAHNNEWDYAESFIEMNDILDEERKEGFLQALHGLKDERENIAQREKELEELREREFEEQRAAAEAKRKADALREEERRKAAEVAQARPSTPSSTASSSRPLNGHAANGKPGSKPPPKTPKALKKSHSPPRPPPGNIYNQATTVFNNIQDMFLQASKSMNINSFVLMRLLLFVMAMVLLLARRNLREKLKKALGDGWIKVQRTVGMGVKVSYI